MGRLVGLFLVIIGLVFIYLGFSGSDSTLYFKFGNPGLHMSFMIIAGIVVIIGLWLLFKKRKQLIISG